MKIYDWVMGSAFVLFVLGMFISLALEDWAEAFGIIYTIREHALFERYWFRGKKEKRKTLYSNIAFFLGWLFLFIGVIISFIIFKLQGGI